MFESSTDGRAGEARRVSGAIGRWALALAVLWPASATAQMVEATGARALGLGGAFVAAANDASTTWWNPAGLAVGPLADVTIGVGRLAPIGRDDGWRGQWGVGISTPALGAHFYDLGVLTTIAHRPTASSDAGRQEGRVAPLPSSLRFSQFGVTVLQTIFSRVHVGATVKGVRATSRDLVADRSESHIDADVGVLGAFGPVRVGVVGRQLFQPWLWRGSTEGAGLRLDRQLRLGLAFDGERRPVAVAAPWLVSFDVDLHSYDTLAGRRRVVATGAERWWRGKRLGLRAGARVNTEASGGRAAAAGVSVAVVKGVLAEGQVTFGSRSERSWTIAARASF